MRRYILLKSDSYQRDWKATRKVIKHPPHTWDKYKGVPNEFDSIIEMEIKELMECRATKNYSCYVENLLHVSAACLYAHHAMTCKEKD